MDTVRYLGPPVLALLTVLAFDALSSRRGLQPPAFLTSVESHWQQTAHALLRRWLSLAMLWFVLWLGVFAALGSAGQEQQLDLSRLQAVDLFLLHGLLSLSLVAWYLLGFVRPGSGPTPPAARWTSQLGWHTVRVAPEVAVGLIAGVAAWLLVLGVLLCVGLLIWWLGGEEWLPSEPPALIPWIAALPLWLRLAISISAGVVEETFFRGFLQPRVGVVLSTMLFILAHASYQQPLMLLGIGLLSLVYAGLVRWRQNIWPAIVAHALFDTLQLLVVIPAALRLLPEDGEGMVPPLAALVATLGGLRLL